mgnify:CR=1 FL=1
METGIGAIFKEKYCLGDYLQCARHRVLDALGAAFVPDTLYPTMCDISDRIIAENQEKVR